MTENFKILAEFVKDISSETPDVQNKIYPNLEKTFLNLLHNSGFPGIKLEKKIDFTQLYKLRSN